MKQQLILIIVVSLLMVGTNCSAEKGTGTESYKTFYDAAVFGDEPTISAWLKKDPTAINSKDKYGFTPLHGAVGEDRPEIVKLLIAAGANINAVNDEGITPLHIVAYADLLDILVDGGANIESKDKDGNTPLLVQAAEADSTEILEALLKKGADTTAKNKRGETALDIALAREEEDKVELLKEFLEKRRMANDRSGQKTAE